MQFHFRNKMFDYNKLLKVIALILFYNVLAIFPYVSGCYYQPVVKLNIEEIFARFNEMMFLFSVFGVGINFLSSEIFTKFIPFVVINEYIKTRLINIIFIDINKENELDLNVSNPFLYSSKTRGLLE